MGALQLTRAPPEGPKANRTRRLAPSVGTSEGYSQPFDTQVFVDLGPMYAFTVPEDFVVLQLCACRPRQDGETTPGVP